MIRNILRFWNSARGSASYFSTPITPDTLFMIDSLAFPFLRSPAQTDQMTLNVAYSLKDLKTLYRLVREKLNSDNLFAGSCDAPKRLFHGFPNIPIHDFPGFPEDTYLNSSLSSPPFTSPTSSHVGDQVSPISAANFNESESESDSQVVAGFCDALSPEPIVSKNQKLVPNYEARLTRSMAKKLNIAPLSPLPPRVPSRNKLKCR